MHTSKKARKPVVQTNSTPRVIRELIYLQDETWSRRPILFRTDCPKSLKEIERMSWEVYGAGRIPVGFDAFQTVMRKHGFECTLVEYLPSGSKPPAGYDVVEGAYGNY